MAVLLDIREGERALTVRAVLGLLFAMAAHTLLETARDALFLARLPAERLPWMYLAIAVAGLGISRLATRGGLRLSRLLLVACALTTGFWWLAREPGPALLYAIFIYSGTLGSFLVLQFWLLLGQVFHVGQAKRLFGLIGAGGVLGATVGAVLARVLTEVLPARDLVLASGAVFALAAWPAAGLGAEAQLEAASAPSAAHERGEPRQTSLADDLNEVWQGPYLRRILLVTLASTITLTLVDYLFKSLVAASVPKEDLGRTFASIYAVLNGLSLLVQLGLVGALLRWLGAPRALLLLPALVLLSGSALVLWMTLPMVLLMKGVEGAFRHSLHRTASELLTLPIPDASRKRSKPVIELVAQRGGQALISLGILGAVSLGLGSRGLAVCATIAAVFWLLLARGLGRPYLEAFRRVLKRGQIDADGELPELDLGALEALFAGLNSQSDPEVLGSLDLLAAQRRHRLVPALILYHPSSEVVLRALTLFREEGRDDFVPVADRLLSHADPRVRAAALSARTRVRYEPELLQRLLEDSEVQTQRPELAATALVALVSHGELAEQEGMTKLRETWHGSPPVLRRALAQAIGSEPSLPFAKLLQTLLTQDETREVAAALAMAVGEHAELRGIDRVALANALAPCMPRRVAGGPAREAAGRLWRANPRGLVPLLSHPTAAVRAAIPRVLELCEPEQACLVLSEQLASHSDGMVRFRLLKALKNLKREHPALPMDSAALTSQGLSHAKRALSLIDLRLRIERSQEVDPSRKTPAGILLHVLTRDKTTYALGRVFMTLSLLYPRENFDRVMRSALGGDKRSRASARELCESVVKAPLREPLSLLLDDLPDVLRVQRAAAYVNAVPEDYNALVQEIGLASDEIGALARHHAGELGLVVLATADDGTWGAFARELNLGTRQHRNDEAPHA